MQFPDEFSFFWSACVNPTTHCQITVAEGTTCCLTNCCVDNNDDNFFLKGSRITLFLSVNKGETIPIVPFIISKFESTNLDIQFPAGSEVIFSTDGCDVPIHICGYVIGDSSLHIRELTLNDTPIQSPIMEHPIY